MNLNDFLKQSGFKQVSDDQFTMRLANYTIDAYINGKGVIFHINMKDGKLLCTIQQDDLTDIADSFIALIRNLLYSLGLKSGFEINK